MPWPSPYQTLPIASAFEARGDLSSLLPALLLFVSSIPREMVHERWELLQVIIACGREDSRDLPTYIYMMRGSEGGDDAAFHVCLFIRDSLSILTPFLLGPRLVVLAILKYIQTPKKIDLDKL